ncbi:hypothetical protein NC652_034147 [Populus alba x Populus x berolinensis]|nr:hypothetical protein NC652_034147 [Populus alba x Populus x berolinensis]
MTNSRERFSAMGVPIVEISLRTSKQQGAAYSHLDVRVKSSSMDIENAAKKANAPDFISKFPDKYQNFRRENRLVLWMLKVIISLQDAMDSLMNGRTVIVISHRLSTVQSADISWQMFLMGRTTGGKLVARMRASDEDRPVSLLRSCILRLVALATKLIEKVTIKAIPKLPLCLYLENQWVSCGGDVFCLNDGENATDLLVNDELGTMGQDSKWIM